MIGIKIYDKPNDLETVLHQWRDLSIDTAFIGPRLHQEKAFIERLRENGINVYTIFPVFYDKKRLADHPDEYALTCDGHKAIQEWLKFACPSSQRFMNHKLDELVDMIETVRPCGVSLDFIRFFAFWEKVSPSNAHNLKQTCFDDRCLCRFESEMGIVIPREGRTVADQGNWILEKHKEEWVEWKCRLVENVVQQLTDKIREIDPGMSIGLHSVPWLPQEYDGAVKAITGQNLAYLSPYVDFFTPMCYSHMLKQDPQWINDIVVDQTTRGRKVVIPSVQVARAYLEEEFPVDRFEQALKMAVQKPSEGVVLWSWQALDQSEEKRAVVKRVLGQ
ncbi:MAG: hypothetical protein GY832_15955 [Chloroflexi bacterium]|nr:hypothetical protein [Chloroflexota bacterium]